MLREEQDVRQIPGDLKRRWFSDDFFDLIVWFDDRGRFHGFQLCYDRTAAPRALTWRKDLGYAHDKIDDGESRAGLHKSSPMLSRDGFFDAKSIGDRLEAAGAGLPKELLEPVLEKVRAFRAAA